ncbi:MAG: hypothetical protein JKY99_01615 [Rhizobiales bacterium]|nr:hypothetical protein [Hyphomicrobiales bacterium]
MIKVYGLLCGALLLTFAGAAIAQDLRIGDADFDGRTFLLDEPLEGVYSNYWSGMRVSGDGSDQTDVHIRSDGKLPFDGILSLNCSAPDGHFWLLGEDQAMGLVPQQAIANAREFFCG